MLARNLLILLPVFLIAAKGYAKESYYASVPPNQSLFKLGCSIAKALKDPQVGERCNRFLHGNEDTNTNGKKSMIQNIFNTVKNENLNL